MGLRQRLSGRALPHGGSPNRALGLLCEGTQQALLTGSDRLPHSCGGFGEYCCFHGV